MFEMMVECNDVHLRTFVCLCLQALIHGCMHGCLHGPFTLQDVCDVADTEQVSELRAPLLEWV